MRTTISLDDRLGEAARRRARQEGLPLSALVARALESFLARRDRDAAVPPFRLVTVRGTGVQPGIDLDRSSDLLLAEDEVNFGVRTRGQ